MVEGAAPFTHSSSKQGSPTNSSSSSPRSWSASRTRYGCSAQPATRRPDLPAPTRGGPSDRRRGTSDVRTQRHLHGAPMSPTPSASAPGPAVRPTPRTGTGSQSPANWPPSAHPRPPPSAWEPSSSRPTEPNSPAATRVRAIPTITQKKEHSPSSQLVTPGSAPPRSTAPSSPAPNELPDPAPAPAHPGRGPPPSRHRVEGARHLRHGCCGRRGPGSRRCNRHCPPEYASAAQAPNRHLL